MENPENKRDAKDIENEIRNLKDELKEVQEGCQHKDKIIKFAEDGHSVYKYCKDCNKKVGHPSEQELKDNGFM